MGMVPIVKTSTIDVLFAGMPVLILEDWADLFVSPPKVDLDRVYEEFVGKGLLPVKDEVFTVEYWLDHAPKPAQPIPQQHPTVSDVSNRF